MAGQFLGKPAHTAESKRQIGRLHNPLHNPAHAALKSLGSLTPTPTSLLRFPAQGDEKAHLQGRPV